MRMMYRRAFVARAGLTAAGLALAPVVCAGGPLRRLWPGFRAATDISWFTYYGPYWLKSNGMLSDEHVQDIHGLWDRYTEPETLETFPSERLENLRPAAGEVVVWDYRHVAWRLPPCSARDKLSNFVFWGSSLQPVSPS